MGGLSSIQFFSSDFWNFVNFAKPLWLNNFSLFWCACVIYTVKVKVGLNLRSSDIFNDRMISAERRTLEKRRHISCV